MRITATKDQKRTLSSDLVIAPVFEDFIPEITLSALGSNEIPKMASRTGFKGKMKQTAFIEANGRTFLLTGLGKKAGFKLEVLRRSYAESYSKLKGTGSETVAILLPGILDGEAFEAAYIIRVSHYYFDTFQGEKTAFPDLKIQIVTEKGQDVLDAALKIGEATNYTRDAANMPPSRGTPSLFEKMAREIPGIEVTAFGREDFLKLGMGGLEGVSRAAAEPGKLVIMEYGPKEQKPLLLVGKGITFDSGGISIKPSEAMNEMKFDKCGASAVLGIMKLASDLKLKKHIVGMMPLTENLPGGNAYKPGDILRHYNGKTSEILSTDAEGRLVLADALSYGVEKFDPYAVVDFATLTGACIIALGNNIAGLMGTDEKLISQIKGAASKTWERVWELPIDQDFMDQIKSDVADIKNTGGRPGGAETAGAFLRHFVGEKPWVHLDIAGVAWTQAKTVKTPYLPTGATGFGVRLIYQYLMEN